MGFDISGYKRIFGIGIVVVIAGGPYYVKKFPKNDKHVKMFNTVSARCLIDNIG